MKCSLDNNKIRAYYLMLLFILLHSLAFGQKKAIQVEFKILEVEYIEFYTQDSINWIEQEGAKILSGRLAEYFPYFDFDPDTGSIVIQFHIEREKSHILNDFSQQVDIHIVLPTRTGSAQITARYLFRDKVQFHNFLPDSNEAFLAEFDQVITIWFESERELLISDVMKHISLTEIALLDNDKKNWIMPFGHEEMSIGDSTEFVISSIIETSDIEQKVFFRTVANGKIKETSNLYPPEYRGKILTTIKGNVDPLNLNHPNLKINGIFLLKFRRPIILRTYSPPDIDIDE